MKQSHTQERIHSITKKVSILGLILGLPALSIWIISSQSLPSYATPAGLWSIIGTYNPVHTPGSFDTSGGGGNAGQLTFISEADETALGGSGVYLDTTNTGSQKLVGNFFVETVGWVNFDTVSLIPPTNMNIMTPWTLSGYVWSEKAGYIDMTNNGDTSYSGASYVPGTQAFSGYAWSENLGYIPFFPTTPTFRNKVKILGNIGGNKLNDTEYALGAKFDMVTTASAINSVRQNVALLTRSLPTNLINIVNTISPPAAYNNIIYYKVAGGIVPNPGTNMDNKNARTLIVEGGNIYIDSDIAKDDQVNSPRVMIAIKNAAGQGGRIYIGKNVKNIYSSLIAEGQISSGEQKSNMYNDTIEEITHLPPTQLYINGTVISRNTIGGSAQTPASCPFTENTCDYTTAIQYDWNYFRTYDKKPANASNKPGYDDYSVIIEYDPRIVADAPPGMRK